MDESTSATMATAVAIAAVLIVITTYGLSITMPYL